ncbi:SoxR reducing system RseC family protein [Clostridium sp. JN-1]|jgi:positive regulator of sigma E activity|uniref:SoxR reducing system RseC family protein n=1 Tax=Clostridium sp. JN-1 TaxID=2483110 RepID=UPI000F0BBBE7|nr:SoxR reducing system RseC family protein [Clostridium sp. JN-1]
MNDEKTQSEVEQEEKAPKQKKETNMLLAAFMLFILPIAAIFLGVFLGGYIAESLNKSIYVFRIAGGVIGFVLSVITMKVFDKKTVVSDKPERYYWEDM